MREVLVPVGVSVEVAKSMSYASLCGGSGVRWCKCVCGGARVRGGVREEANTRQAEACAAACHHRYEEAKDVAITDRRAKMRESSQTAVVAMVKQGGRAARSFSSVGARSAQHARPPVRLRSDSAQCFCFARVAPVVYAPACMPPCRRRP